MEVTQRDAMAQKYIEIYPRVNTQKTMENHHVQWENPLFLWPFSIAILTQPEGRSLVGCSATI